jgi:two-component system sensor histidine kinase PhoQ
LRFHGDEGDLMELLGNLLDNAHKWCRREVRIGARALTTADTASARLSIRVEDDGPGFPAAEGDRLFERGRRADQVREGHGLGLAVVRDIVRVYDGTVALGESEALGGAEVTVSL